MSLYCFVFVSWELFVLQWRVRDFLTDDDDDDDDDAIRCSKSCIIFHMPLQNMAQKPWFIHCSDKYYFVMKDCNQWSVWKHGGGGSNYAVIGVTLVNLWVGWVGVLRSTDAHRHAFPFKGIKIIRASLSGILSFFTNNPCIRQSSIHHFVHPSILSSVYPRIHPSIISSIYPACIFGDDDGGDADYDDNKRMDEWMNAWVNRWMNGWMSKRWK